MKKIILIISTFALSIPSFLVEDHLSLMIENSNKEVNYEQTILKEGEIGIITSLWNASQRTITKDEISQEISIFSKTPPNITYKTQKNFLFREESLYKNQYGYSRYVLEFESLKGKAAISFITYGYSKLAGEINGEPLYNPINKERLKYLTLLKKLMIIINIALVVIITIVGIYMYIKKYTQKAFLKFYTIFIVLGFIFIIIPIALYYFNLFKFKMNPRQQENIHHIKNKGNSL